MTAEELRALMSWLQERVVLARPGEREIVFAPPTKGEMVAAGFPAAAAEALLGAPWWEEMVGDILDTPSFSSPDEAPEQVLAYARDVVAEYLRKRVQLA